MGKNEAKQPTAIMQANRRGFTLVELLIVVSILGILAAIVLPEFQGHAKMAKESAGKDSLRVLREAIERYAAEHDGVPPGYPSNVSTGTPTELNLRIHLLFSNPKYLPEIPVNPFNGCKSVRVLDNLATFPATPEATELIGWVYQPRTKTVKLNYSGSDDGGTAYYAY